MNLVLKAAENSIACLTTSQYFTSLSQDLWITIPDSKVYGANMGPTWVLSAPDGPHVGPMNLAIRDATQNEADDSISHTICNVLLCLVLFRSYHLFALDSICSYLSGLLHQHLGNHYPGASEVSLYIAGKTTITYKKRTPKCKTCAYSSGCAVGHITAKLFTKICLPTGNLHLPMANRCVSLLIHVRYIFWFSAMIVTTKTRNIENRNRSI